MYENIIDYYREHEKATQKIGVEIELLGFQEKKRISYKIVSSVLHKFVELYKWEGLYEEASIIGVRNSTGEITLEPGSQLEWSSVPFDTIATFQEYYAEFKKQLLAISQEISIEWYFTGYDPISCYQDISFIPKKRYSIFREYFSQPTEFQMMLCSCSLQLSFDYSSEKDMYNKLLVGNIVSFLAAAVTNNSVIFERKTNEILHYRGWIWNNFDPSRSQFVKNIFKEDFSYGDYIDYVLEAPAIFFRKDGQWIAGEKHY